MGITSKTKTGNTKRTVSKPSAAVIAKYVAKAKQLARKNHGKLPSYTWLDKHGFFPLYECLRLHTKNFAGLKRSFKMKKKASSKPSVFRKLKDSFAA